jgi:hypothetical protein
MLFISKLFLSTICLYFDLLEGTVSFSSLDQTRANRKYFVTDFEHSIKCFSKSIMMSKHSLLDLCQKLKLSILGFFFIQFWCLIYLDRFLNNKKKTLYFLIKKNVGLDLLFTQRNCYYYFFQTVNLNFNYYLNISLL